MNAPRMSGAFALRAAECEYGFMNNSSHQKNTGNLLFQFFNIKRLANKVLGP
jgi:hypothetical protein